MNSQCPPCSCLEKAAQSNPCTVVAREQNSQVHPCPCQNLCPCCFCDPPQVLLGVTSPSLPVVSGPCVNPVKIPRSGQEPFTFETPGMCMMSFPLQKSILTVELCPPETAGTFPLPQEELGVTKTTGTCLENLQEHSQELPIAEPCILEVAELGTDEPCQAQGMIQGDPCRSQSGIPQGPCMPKSKISMDPCGSQSGISMDPCGSQSGISMDPCRSQSKISLDPCGSQSGISMGPCMPQSKTSMDPCGSQSGISTDPCASQSGISMDPCGSQRGISMDPCGSQRGISMDPCGSQSGISMDPCGSQSGISMDPCASQSGISIDPCASQSGISTDPCGSQSGISTDPCSSKSGISTDPCGSQSQGPGDTGDAKDTKPQTSPRNPFRLNSRTSRIVERCLSRCQSWFQGKI